MRFRIAIFVALSLICAAVAPSASAAEPTAETLAILKTFRAEFVDVRPGKGDFPAEFSMGDAAGEPDERPPHTVKIARPFAIARYEVPQNLWQAVMGENPSRWKGPRNSVEMLSYADAVQFCKKATEQLRAADLIRANQVVRLPSEAEWEYSARAGTKTRFSFGDNARDLDEYGWHTGNAAGNDPAVGVKRGNAWKLHDTHGYLWEWCADAWHDNYEGAPADGSAWNAENAKQRVLRGGSWKDKADRCRSASRRAANADLKDDAVGLRCVLGDEG